MYCASFKKQFGTETLFKFDVNGRSQTNVCKCAGLRDISVFCSIVAINVLRIEFTHFINLDKAKKSLFFRDAGPLSTTTFDKGSPCIPLKYYLMDGSKES